MFLFGVYGSKGGFDPLILLVFALILESVLGRFSNLTRVPFAPVTFIAGVVSWCERKLNREGRSSGDRAARGATVALLIIFVAGSSGWGVSWLTQNIAIMWILETLVITLSLDQRGTYTIVQNSGRALRREDLPQARKHLSLISCQSVDSMDLHHLVRTGLEVSAFAIARGAAGPVFWYVLFGLPGLMVFKAIDVMAELVGHQTDQYRAFGFTAGRLHDILMFLPARLAGIYMVLGSVLVPTAKPSLALKVMLRDGGKHYTFNFGWPLGAMAGALNLALAGPRMVNSVKTSGSWIGEGTAKATAVDISRGLYLSSIACLINAAWVAALSVVRLV